MTLAFNRRFLQTHGVMQRRHVIWFSFAFWTLIGVISGTQVWLSMITHGHSAPWLIAYHVLTWQGWFLASLVIARLGKRVPVLPVTGRSVLIHFLAALAFGIAHSFYSIGLMVLMQPYDAMTSSFAEIRIPTFLLGRLAFELSLYVIVLGFATAIDFYDRYRERALQAAQLETSLADARLHALELQLQPHFLFNTMNAISSLVRNRRNEEAVAMISGLSDLLRYTLDHAGDQQVALEDELAVLRRYLEIQHVRFPDRMSFEIDLAPEARRAAVPVLLLQPLAENAVRHGIARSAGAGSIKVRAFRDEGKLRIEMVNSGTIGTSPEEGSGIGLRNTRARLQHLYGDDGHFELTENTFLEDLLPVTGEGGRRTAEGRREHGQVVASLTIPWSEVA